MRSHIAGEIGRGPRRERVDAHALSDGFKARQFRSRRRLEAFAARQPGPERLDRALEEAARSLGATPWQVLRDVVLPGLRPALISAGAICFATSMGAFGTAFTLATNINVLPITIYTEFTNYANFSIAAALSLVLGVITWAALAVARTLAGSTVAAAA